MTPEIGLVLAILAAAVFFFVSEKLRVDVVAILVLVALALTGLVTPEEALAGFSNPAVITVWAVFILSGGLARTGVASLIGRQVLKLAGSGEVRLIFVIMLTSAFLSAFMNNVGVAALLLPVVMDIARRTGQSPSKLLIPLAFSSLLGGLTTLIGTPPNLLISESLRELGGEPFALFDFAPVGSAVVLAGILFMALVGRHMLPVGETPRRGGEEDLGSAYDLAERLFILHLPPDSELAGKTLVESRLGQALGFNVVGILRGKGTRLAPGPHQVLEGNDRLLVEGRADRLAELGGDYFEFDTEKLTVERLVSSDVDVVKVEILPGSPLVGETLASADFRHHYGAVVLAIRRGEEVFRTQLETHELAAGDRLVVQGTVENLALLWEDPHLEGSLAEEGERFDLEERLMVVRLAEGSPLVGKTLVDSHLGRAYGIGVMGIVREGKTDLIPDPREALESGDTLLIKGRREDLETLEGLSDLKLETQRVSIGDLESERIGLIEVVLSPRTTLAGKTLGELHFRDKYGLNVVAINRAGETFRTGLRDMPLRFGDALLLHGPREKFRVLGAEPDFLVLTTEAQEPPRTARAPVAALLMLAVVTSVVVGWLPIYIAAVTGAVLMVVSGCLSMDEAYRAIEWRAVFLIAGMLPLGVAMQQTGAATLLTQQAVTLVGDSGKLAVVATLFMVTAFAAQVMPTAAVAILMAPIAFNTATNLGISSRALLMAVALSASASFMSPVAHPANVLIMAPGGYRFLDYIKVGLPLTLVCLLTVLLVLPVFWPL